MRRCAILLLCTLAVACAGAPKSVAMQETRQEGAAYERILGSFSIEPRQLVLLDPGTATARLYRQGAPRVDSLVDRFHGLGEVRGEAAARLARAAFRWNDGEARAAYEDVVEAQALFGEVNDVGGLAKTYEWLGFIFKESGAFDRAAEHLGIAYRLYGMLENEHAQARVLAYAN